MYIQKVQAKLKIRPYTDNMGEGYSLNHPVLHAQTLICPTKDSLFSISILEKKVKKCDLYGFEDI